MTTPAEHRAGDARARLSILGDPEPGEPVEVAMRREHYLRILDEAETELAAEAEADPYRNRKDLDL